MSGLFGRDSIYLLVWGLQVGFAALSIPISTRVLGSTRYGNVATAIAMMQILVALGTGGLPTAVQRHYRKGDAKDSRRIVTLSMLAASGMFAIASLSGPLWAPLLHLRFAGMLQYAVGWAALTSVTYIGLGLLRSAGRLKTFSLVSLVQSVIAEIVAVLLVLFVHRSATEFVLGELLAQAGAVAIVLISCRPLPITRRHIAFVRGVLGYSLGLLPAAVSSFVLANSDRLIIKHYLPVLQVSRYSAVYNIAAIPVLLLGVLDTVWLPRFFEIGDTELLPRLLADSRDAVYRLVIPVVIGLSVGAPLVLAVWVRADFHRAGLPLVIATIALSAFPMAGMVAANRVLLITGRTVTVGLCTVAAAVSNAALNIAVVPSMGIEGAALSTLLAYAALQALVVSIVRRTHTIRRPPPLLIVQCALAALAAVGSTALPSHGVLAAARGVIVLGCLVAFGLSLVKVIAPSRWSGVSERFDARYARR